MRIAVLVGIFALFAQLASAQITIDDKRIILDSGVTLESYINNSSIQRVKLIPSQYPSSTTSGLAEVIASATCTNGCLVMIPSGTFTFTCTPGTMSTDQGCFEIFERSDIFFAGAGYDRTILEWSYNSKDFATPFRMSMIRVYGRDDDAVGGPVPSSNILFHNMTIAMHDLCNPTTDLCDDQALTATLKIQEAEDVQIITSQITCDDLHGDYSEINGQICRAIWVNGDEWRGVTNGGDYPSRRVWLTNCKVAGSGRGLEFHFCKDCWVSGSMIFSPTEEDPSLRPTTKGMFVKYLADGVRATNNTFSMKGLSGDFWGVLLLPMAGGQRDLEAGAYLQLTGNTWIGNGARTTARGCILTNPNHMCCTALNEPFDCCTGSGTGDATCDRSGTQIEIQGYNFANIANNVFSCDDRSYCISRGINFTNTGVTCEYPDGSTGNCNSGNVIANNIWHRWVPANFEGQTGGGFLCPIVLDNPATLSPIDAAGNNGMRNIFSGNLFDLASTSGTPVADAGTGGGFSGFCWSNESFAMQTIIGNQSRVAHQGAVYPRGLLEDLSLVPCESGNQGMILSISDGDSATDCNPTTTGAFEVLCRCDGTTWTAL